MRRFSDAEIIAKARSKIVRNDEVDLDKDPVDVTVDIQDEHEVTHSYVVSFTRSSEESGKDWRAIDISEVSSL